MKIVIASGKGGVGKSMLASSLAILFSKSKKIVACDCDVDAPNLNLWLGEVGYNYMKKVSTSEKAFINSKKCIECGKCEEVCVFNAIEKEDGFKVNPFLCEGCGACKLVCPVNAIELKPVENGEIRVKLTKFNFPLIYGKLYPGESGSGKIVEELKRKMEEFDHEIAILDSAAGIGCPVIASIRGSDFAVLITEPTPSGFSDLKRILEVVDHFKIPYGIVINKWNINKKLSKKMKDWAGEKFLGKISYDRKVIDCIVNLKPVIESESVVKNEIEKIFQKIEELIFSY